MRDSLSYFIFSCIKVCDDTLRFLTSNTGIIINSLFKREVA